MGPGVDIAAVAAELIDRCDLTDLAMIDEDALGVVIGRHLLDPATIDDRPMIR